MTLTTAPIIEIDDRGVAKIKGTTAKVIEVVLIKLGDNLSPEQVQAELSHLSLAQVKAALAYYDAHREDMDAQIEFWAQWAEEMQSKEHDALSREELLARLTSRR